MCKKARRYEHEYVKIHRMNIDKVGDQRSCTRIFQSKVLKVLLLVLIKGKMYLSICVSLSASVCLCLPLFFSKNLSLSLFVSCLFLSVFVSLCVSVCFCVFCVFRVSISVIYILYVCNTVHDAFFLRLVWRQHSHNVLSVEGWHDLMATFAFSLLGLCSARK